MLEYAGYVDLFSFLFGCSGGLLEVLGQRKAFTVVPRQAKGTASVSKGRAEASSQLGLNFIYFPPSRAFGFV